MYSFTSLFALFAGLFLFFTSAARAEWHARAVFITDARLAVLKERVAQKKEPTWSAWQKVQKMADAGLSLKVEVPQHWQVPGAYKDPQGCGRANRPLDISTKTSYYLALVYRITGDEKYAEAAVRLIKPWCTGIKSYSKAADSTLSFSYHVPAMMAAADLLKHSPSFSRPDQELFKRFVCEQALPMNCMARKNNWGNWGLLLVMAAAVYLDDEKLFNTGITRWKQLLETQQDNNGILTGEVGRSEGRMGIWYTNFCLLPQTLCAEVARVNGVKLFDYTSPTGRSLRDAYERSIPWLKDPASFPYYKGNPKDLVGVNHIPHFELLVPRWPNPDAAALLQKVRPIYTHYGIPAETFTHGDVPIDL